MTMTDANATSPVPNPRTPQGRRAMDRQFPGTRRPRPCRLKIDPAPETRRRLVSDLAYSFACRRGFTAGHELDDWLAAEREVDAWFQADRFSGD